MFVTFTFTSSWNVWRDLEVSQLGFTGNCHAIEIRDFPKRCILVYLRNDNMLTYRFYDNMRIAKAQQTRLHNRHIARESICYTF